MSSVSNTITNDSSYTAQSQAKTDTLTGAASSLTSNDFLNLMIEQLKYQDPMSPTDNSEFISQECQFAQLQATQDMSSNMSQNNSIMQTLSLVGKEVTLTDPDDATKTITGTVDEAKFNSTGSVIVVNDKEYPISLIQAVREVSASGADSNSGSGSDSGSDSGSGSGSSS